MRKTKIVCTIGPACENEETIKQMILAGMNVARLNFSHNTVEDHLRRIQIIKKVRKELGIPVAILLDTKGPEYRVGVFKDGKVFIETGSKFTFTTEEVIGDETITSVNYKNLNKDFNNKSKTKDAEEVIKNWLKRLEFDINDAYRLSWDDKYTELCKNKGVEGGPLRTRDLKGISY